LNEANWMRLLALSVLSPRTVKRGELMIEVSLLRSAMYTSCPWPMPRSEETILLPSRDRAWQPTQAGVFTPSWRKGLGVWPTAPKSMRRMAVGLLVLQ
jgi:hypothetical protein